MWFELVGRIGAVKAATFHFLNPFLGVAISAIVLDEPFGKNTQKQTNKQTTKRKERNRKEQKPAQNTAGTRVQLEKCGS